MERVTYKEKDLAKLTAYTQLLFTSFTWALSTILVKEFVSSVPVFHLLLGRFAIGSIVVFAAAPKKIFKAKKQEIFIGFFLGIMIFSSYALNIIGLKYTTASKSGFLAALAVLFIPIVESILKKRMPSKWTITCVSLSVVGLYLISGINGTSFSIGDLLTIGCAITYTIYVIALDRLGSRIDAFILSMIQLTSMFILSLLIALLFEGFQPSALMKGILPILIIGVLGTGITMFLQTKAQKVATPESVGIILLGEPIFTLIMAYFFLHEVILFKGLIGSILILTSLVTATMKRI